MKKNKSDKEKKTNLVNYRIFRVETDENTGVEKKITMITFSAKDDKSAYEELKRYRKIANKEYKYYYGPDCTYKIKDKDGNTIQFDSITEMFEYNHPQRWFSAFSALWRWISGIPRRIRNALQRAFTGHCEYEYNDLLTHVLDDIEHNLKILSNDCEYPVMTFVIEAVKQKHSGEKDFDISKRMDDSLKFEEDEIKLGSELMKKTVDGLIEDIRFYRFSQLPLITEDFKDEGEMESFKRFAKIIPYIPGRYNTIDFIKLASIRNKYRNRIFSTLNKYAESLWS